MSHSRPTYTRLLCIAVPLLVLVVAAAARERLSDELAAAPRPAGTKRLRQQFLSSWNRHHVFGADGERVSAELRLELARNGKASLVDSGSRRGSVLSRTWGLKLTTRSWSVSWHGRWKRAAGALRLTLTRRTLRCTTTVERRNEPKTSTPCRGIATTLELRCELTRVRLGKGPTPTKTPVVRTLDAWRCLPTSNSSQPGTTPTPWLFGHTGCIRVIGGYPGRRSHSGCR